MRLKFLSLTLAFALLPMAAQGEDLMEIYRQAHANDPTLAGADATRQSVAEDVPQARALLLPQMNAGLTLEQTNGGDGSTTTNPDGSVISTASSGNVRQRALQGTLSQVVVDFSKFSSLRAAHATVDAGEQTYQVAAQDLLARVATAYITVLVDEDELDYNKAYEDAYKQAYEQASKRFKLGLVAEGDVTQGLSYYQLAKAQTITALNTLKDARRALSQITGQPFSELKKLRNDLPMQPPAPDDAQAWVDVALHTNPAILSGQYTVQAANSTIAQQRAGHLPTINANVDYNKSSTWFGQQGAGASIPGNGRGSTTIGLTLTVPIFSGGLVQSQVRQAIHNRDASQDSLEAQRRQVERDVYNYFQQIEAGIGQVEAARIAVDAGQKALKSSRAGYEIGSQSMLEVVNAISALVEAQLEYTSVRHQFILNKLLLKQTAGTLEAKDLEDVNALLQ